MGSLASADSADGSSAESIPASLNRPAEPRSSDGCVTPTRGDEMGVLLILAEEDSSRGLEMTEALVLVFFRDSLETDTLRLSSAVAIATLSSNSLRTAGSS